MNIGLPAGFLLVFGATVHNTNLTMLYYGLNVFPQTVA